MDQHDCLILFSRPY